MQLKLAGSCLFGALFLFVSSSSANIQRNAEVPLRLKLIEQAKLKLASLPAIEEAIDQIASLPSVAESFFHHLGAPETRDLEVRDTIDAPKDTRTPTSLERAQAALAESNAPALSHNELCSSLVDVAQANELPVGFFTNLIWQESRFDHEAISPVGAMGIAQFMPDTAERMGLEDAFNGRQALPASGKLLRTLTDRFGNLGLAAAAYNAGPKRVIDWLAQRSGLPKETRDYVSVITGKPVEEWRGVKDKAVVFTVPRAVPCHRAAHFVAIEQSERTVQVARVEEERQRAIAKAREEQRLAEEARKAAARRVAEARKSGKKDKKEFHVVSASRRADTRQRANPSKKESRVLTASRGRRT
jgi:soluble lytic murein transglycosylase-like protein